MPLVSDTGFRPRNITLDIVKSVGAIRDRHIRPRLFAEKLSLLDDWDVLTVFSDLYYLAAERIPRYFEAYLIDLDIEIIGERMGAQRMSELYQLARDNDLHHVVSLLLRPKVHVEITREEREKANYELNEMPLGIKKSKARSNNLEIIKRLTRELHPHVVRILLTNPRVNEIMVVEMAARRPTAAEAQREIFHNRKWMTRDKVRQALAKNPYTPPDIAIRLLNVLKLQDTKEVARNAKLHPDVRQAANNIIYHRAAPEAADFAEKNLKRD